MARFRQSFFFLFILALIPLSGSTVYAAENSCFIREDAALVYIGNQNFTLAFDKVKGLLVSAKTAGKKGVDIFAPEAASPDRGLFSLYLDDSAPTIWSARLARRVDARSLKLSAIEPKISSETCSLVLRYVPAGASGITASVFIEVVNASETAKLRLDIENKSKAVIAAAVFPEIAGLKTGAPSLLVWPEGRGKIFRNPEPEFLRVLPFPAPASMQWFYYAQGDSSLLLAALDNSASYKELRFGLDRVLDASVGCSFTFYPFADSEKSWHSPDVLLGIGMKSWHEGAGIYRKWLVEEAKWIKDPPD